jgi:hypothetical protein
MRITTLLSFLSILTTFTFARAWNIGDECPTQIKTLIHGGCFSRKLRYSYCDTNDTFRSMDSVHAALSHCPDITGLDLRIIDPYGDSSLDLHWFNFDPLGGEKFANLTSVRLDGYDFSLGQWFWDDIIDERPWRWDSALKDVSARWLSKMLAATKLGRTVQGLLKLQPKKTHLDLWMDAMDWSRVEELSIDSFEENDITDEMMEKLVPQLKSLVHLETRNTTFIAALPNNTLTHLKWVGYGETESTLLTILEQQGQSLQSLEFRQPERLRGPFPADFDIAILPKMTHNLTHLAINVPRNGTWPLETLSVIASLPQLRSANVYMNLQSSCAQQRMETHGVPAGKWKEDWSHSCTGEEQFQKPFVDKKGAQEMFRHMRKEKKGVALNNVTFYVGDWSGGPSAPSCVGEDWFVGKRAKVICSESRNGEEDDEWCIVDGREEYWQEG